MKNEALLVEVASMRIDEVKKKLRTLGIGEADLPINTVRRWSAANLLPKPKSVYHNPKGGPGRYGEWPPETVEQAAAIHMARTSIQAATIKRVKLSILKEAKRFVEQFYAVVDDFNRTNDPGALKFETLYEPVELPDGKRGVVFGGWDLNTLIVTLIATLEKVRHNISIFEPMTVRFSWNWHVVGEDGRGELKMMYDGVTFESSRENTVGTHVGYTPEALAFQRSKWPASQMGLHRFDFIDKNSDWDRVSIDTRKQTIVVEYPGKKDLIVVDLTCSGFRICADDESRKRGTK